MLALLVQKYLLTGTQVQILTQKAVLRERSGLADADVCLRLLTYADAC
jgi:hypothetical protein